jgi:hypothetical protein
MSKTPSFACLDTSRWHAPINKSFPASGQIFGQARNLTATVRFRSAIVVPATGEPAARAVAPAVRRWLDLNDPTQTSPNYLLLVNFSLRNVKCTGIPFTDNGADSDA